MCVFNQSSLRLLKKKPLLTQTQEGCSIELKDRNTKYASLEGSRTIRRGQFGVGQFGAKYDINFIESSAFIQRYSFHQSRFYFSKILFINPASISAIFFQ